jgi:light-regulated signal transduction histidine kinase (bacteriophytochrome)
MQTGTLEPQEPVLTDRFRQYYTSFIELASHDLQSPIRKLEVLTESLVNKYSVVEEEDAQQYIRRIKASTFQLRSLVESLCEWASLLPDLMEWELVDGNHLAQHVLVTLSTHVRQHVANVEVGQLPLMYGDQRQLEILFRKVISNSLLFRSRDKRTEIYIESSEPSVEEIERFKLTSSGYDKITFSDNGIGIEEADLERVFQPLIRLNGKTEYPGNGLGLACVKRIAENHKGFVYAESLKPLGARINFLIPKNQ